MQKGKQDKIKRLVARLTQEEHDEFAEMCKREGYSMSKRLRTLVNRDVKKEIK